MTGRREVARELRMLRDTALAIPRRDLDPATWQPGEPLFRSPQELVLEAAFTQVARPIFQVLNDRPWLPSYDGRYRCSACDVEWNHLDVNHGGTSCWCCGRQGAKVPLLW